MARPKKQINDEQVEKLASINCSYSEMAAVLSCDPSLLTKRFSQAIKEGREIGKMSLKRKQFDVAMGGNVTMLIWLGKQLLDQREKYDPPPWKDPNVAQGKSKKSFNDFCETAGYPAPFPKQEEMRKFGVDEEGARLILGSRGYGKTDYVVILGERKRSARRFSSLKGSGHVPHPFQGCKTTGTFWFFLSEKKAPSRKEGDRRLFTPLPNAISG